MLMHVRISTGMQHQVHLVSVLNLRQQQDVCTKMIVIQPCLLEQLQAVTHANVMLCYAGGVPFTPFARVPAMVDTV